MWDYLLIHLSSQTEGEHLLLLMQTEECYHINMHILFVPILLSTPDSCRSSSWMNGRP